MDFNVERLKNFPNSVSFLVDSMIQAGKYVFQNQGMVDKPSWLVRSEKFSSFYERIKHKEEAVNKLKLDVFRPLFQTYEYDFNGKIINDKNVVQDEFLKSDPNFHLKAGSLVLPISETYSSVIGYNKQNKIKNNPYPLLILIGLYSSVYNAIKEQETSTTNEYFKNNIQILIDGLEGCDGIPKKQAPSNNNPMNMLQNMMQNFDFKQLTDMMGKVTGDEKASQEFGEVFGKMTESIKNGNNPLEAMGDIIKNASARMEDDEDPDVPLVSEVVEEEKVEEKVEEKEFKPKLDPIPEDEEIDMMASTTM